MKYVSIQLKEYLIEPSFQMCTDCVLFSEDYLNLYAADAALIDTGATRTSVSMDIIRQLNVPSSRQELIEIGNKLHDVNVYNVKMMLSPELVFDLDVYGLPGEGRGAVIVGMDILGKGKLTIEPSKDKRHKGELLIPTP
ncbi:MAG: retroviral-like aspartic protease family protein [Bacteroidaceae bacterium]|nr:retroviral-like aspartic protease family protein [Bacteroidaceae bacterium]